MSPAPPPIREYLHPPVNANINVSVLLTLLGDVGVPARTLLQGTGLDALDVSEGGSRVSIEQWLSVCSHAMRLFPDASLAFRAGAAVHLSDLGMVGLLLQSCATMGEHFRLAVRYQLLASPLLPIDVVEIGNHVLWVSSEPAREWPADLRAFLAAHQAARLSRQVQDALTIPCAPRLACFTHAARSQESLYRQHLGCPCVFDWHRNELHFAREILSLKPRHAHAPTAAMLHSNCDRLLADLESSRSFSGRVVEALHRLGDPGKGMQRVASALKMTDRTLRRRLADEGTSFSTLCRHVKFRLATQRLQESDDTIEQIASIAGFSDPANFRRAFIRWTRMTPTQFRRSQQRGQMETRPRLTGCGG